MTRIGLIGAGVMGRPMAMRLLGAGIELTAFDVDPERVAPLVEAGARAAESVASFGDGFDAVITMLPNGAVVESVVGEGGLLGLERPPSLIVDMSTIEPSRARRLAELATARGVELLDAPVSGGEVGAIEGSLSIMVGGSAAAFAAARPFLEPLGRTIAHMGDSGAGQSAKVCNQVIVAVTYAAVSEALVLGAKAGLDPELLIDVLLGGLAGNRILEVKRRSFVAHDFTPGGSIDMTGKDLRIALESADELNVPLPFTALVQQILRGLSANGHGQLDHSALLTAFEAGAAQRIDEWQGSAG